MSANPTAYNSIGILFYGTGYILQRFCHGHIGD